MERVLLQRLLPGYVADALFGPLWTSFWINYFFKSETYMLEPISLIASCQQPGVSSNICKTLWHCHIKTQGSSGYMSQIKSWPAEANELCLSSGMRLHIPNSKLIRHRAIRDKEKLGSLCFHKMGTVLLMEGCVKLQWHFLQSTEPHCPTAAHNKPSGYPDITQQRGLSFLTQASYSVGKTRQLLIPMVTPEPGRQVFISFIPRVLHFRHGTHLMKLEAGSIHNIYAELEGQNHNIFAVQISLLLHFHSVIPWVQ